MIFLNVNDESIRYTGRWSVLDENAVTTATGAMIEIAFTGKIAVLHFNTFMNMSPYPHLWISVDNGAKIEVPVEHVIRIEAENDGEHLIKIIYKSAVEMQHRWYAPLVGKIDFEGVEVEASAALPEDNRKIIEFIGDSITEGVLIDEEYRFESYDQLNRPYQDDSTATYAYLTAEKLGLKPVIMGYGAVGVTKSGCGSVPKAIEAYPYCFDGEKYTSCNADIIVINHGANDRFAQPNVYISEYEKFLKLVRKINPESKIVVLSAFVGVYPKELSDMVSKFNMENNDNVYFIDSSGWIAKEPLHPTREGHKILSEHLSHEIKKLILEKL